MLVSIIVPVYNVANYLDECVQSILAQSYTEFELILVDDGASDGSGEICDVWKSKDSRITVVHQSNQGVSEARNAGIKQAKGHFITFIDSDDWVGPDYLMHLLNKSKDSDLVVSGLTRIFSNQTKRKAYIDKELNFELSEESSDNFFSMLKEDCFYGPVCKLFKREIIINNNIFFPKGCSYGEDLVFNFHYLEHVKNIVNIPVADYYYRILDSGSLTKKDRKDRFENDYNQWKIIESFCKKRGIINQECYNYLGLKLWGIIYDSLFNKNYQSLLSIKKIVNVEEKNYLQATFKLFQAKNWIKKGIIRKNYFIFYLLKRIRII